MLLANFCFVLFFDEGSFLSFQLLNTIDVEKFGSILFLDLLSEFPNVLFQASNFASYVGIVEIIVFTSTGQVVKFLTSLKGKYTCM